MTNPIRNKIIDELAETIDIPASAYEIAEARYKDLGGWFERPDAICGKFSPHIYPQGSFRLGTVIRPVDTDGLYDLDVGCRLRIGITKASHTQKDLKGLVGADLEAYRLARQVQEELQEMHRCWRLKYADKIRFHIDAVPSIPETEQDRQKIFEAMMMSGANNMVATEIIKHTGAITDNRHPGYAVITPAWRISNSEGYSIWFESRMKIATKLLENRAVQAGKVRVEELPAYRWKSPLQRSVQILKRHRDVMFSDNSDSKPISIILTTLAGQAYNGEVEIADALDAILSGMGTRVRPSKPRVPNPVNPNEDFADKWSDPKYSHLQLEHNFWAWLKQVQIDFQSLTNARSSELLTEMATRKFAVSLKREGLEERIGLGFPAISAPKRTVITEAPAKPWIQR